MIEMVMIEGPVRDNNVVEIDHKKIDHNIQSNINTKIKI
jgi:hypothetical protein